ncbi:MAG: DNA translocase FtsK [Bacilli bacterium]|nr:DNA translocase FtsK [Bacilli bacterium]
MGRKRKSKKNKLTFNYKNELIGIILIVISILSIVSTPYGFVGKIGASLAMFLIGTGYQALLIFTIFLGLFMLVKRDKVNIFDAKLIGLYIIVIGVLVLTTITYMDTSKLDPLKNLFDNLQQSFNGKDLVLSGPGILGNMFSSLFLKLFAKEGTYIVASIFIGGGLVIITGFSIFDWIKDKHEESLRLREEKKYNNELKKERSSVIVNDSSEKEETAPVIDKKIKIHSIDEITNPHKEEMNEQLEETHHEIVETNKEYKLPNISILALNKKTKTSNNEAIERNIEKLETVLKDFGIICKVVEVNVGPSVTQYELEIKTGTKVSKITSLNKEISLALAKKDVRIQAPIPGKSTVGIELANENVQMVGLREILETVPNNKSNSKLLVALGKNIMGNSIYCEIDKTPHLLVAGATGSGKSVCINGIIASILMRTKPTEVKLVLVDPKKVELSMYNGIPHLLIPVVTDPKKANDALKRIVREMEDRYDIFSEKGVKNIATYNEWVDKQNEKLSEENQIRRMHYIVVIIDELADLMLVAAKEVEDSIMRITQMARAAGIHLIVATQRPSTDVITGVVKANIPSRISFAVSSSIDSRTILDMSGAEKLLGKGDMLFLPMGENAPVRVQGAYVSDEDLQKLVDYTVSQQKAQYDERFLNLGTSNQDDDGRMGLDDVRNDKEEYDDPLYNEIVEYAINMGKISASLLQRKYRLGYNRAARIIDLLEERGIVGPPNGSKPREVLIKLEEE